jgi:hypothetical protein
MRDAAGYMHFGLRYYDSRHHRNRSTLVGLMECLAQGRWRQEAHVRNISLLRAPGARRYYCTDRRQRLDLAMEAWVPQDPACAMRDALSATFDRRFASEGRPVEIAVLSDSVGLQVKEALLAAVRMNGNLKHVHFAKSKCNLAVIPNSAAGCKVLLDGIEWPSTRRGSAKESHHQHIRRVLLAGSGTWYNLRPFCNGTGANLFGRGVHEACGVASLGKTIRPEDVRLNHSAPLHTYPRQFTRAYHFHFGTPPWGWYAW